jgi:CubicO group peptidase (beta-lactamase class C family)
MRDIAIARPRGRGRIRAAAAVAAAAFVIINISASLVRVPQQSPIAATDAEVEAFLVDQVREAGYPGAAFAIVRDGRVTRSGGIGRADDRGRPVGADTPFVLGSVTKSITATAVMQLVEAGLVDLDAPVARYLDDFSIASGQERAITVRQLLSQASGLPTSVGTEPLSHGVTSLRDQVRAMRDVSLLWEPGASFAYSNANYVVLGLLIEQVTGKRFGDYVADSVFEPLGMINAHSDLAEARADGLTDAHRFWFGVARSSEPLWRPDLAPAGWLIASANDVGRFAAANLNGGTLDGHRILSPDGIEQLHAGVVAAGRGAYGMGWFDGRLGAARTVSHSGSTTDMASVVYLAPEHRMGIVVLFNGQSVVYELLHKPEAIVEAAFARMLGEPAGGTLVGLYPVFAIATVTLLGLQLRSLARVVRRAARREAVIEPVRGSRPLAAILTVWGRLAVPIVILLTTPATLGAPWDILVHIDLGQILAGYALLQLLIATAMGAAVVMRRMPPRGASASRSVRAEPVG